VGRRHFCLGRWGRPCVPIGRREAGRRKNRKNSWNSAGVPLATCRARCRDGNCLEDQQNHRSASHGRAKHQKGLVGRLRGARSAYVLSCRLGYRSFVLSRLDSSHTSLLAVDNLVFFTFSAYLKPDSTCGPKLDGLLRLPTLHCNTITISNHPMSVPSSSSCSMLSIEPASPKTGGLKKGELKRRTHQPSIARCHSTSAFLA
jgi:hypothetical protein